MKLTAKMLRQIAGARAKEENIQSLIEAFNKYGAKVGLNLPHRQAQFLAQILHESGGLIYNHELWGPTPAQKRYEGRKDLGNIQKGDGAKYRGYGLIQVTGRANVTSFYKWCKAQNMLPPDFVSTPSLIGNAPWSAICAFWYWDVNRINRYSDRGDIEMVTKTINGGLNGYADRLAWYEKASLVLLGYSPKDIKGLQKAAGIVVDGLSGPRTRAAMHKMLVAQSHVNDLPEIITDAPVVEVKVPKQLDKPLTKTSGFWERIASFVGLAGIGGASWLGDWHVILAITAALIVVTAFGLFFQDKIIKAVKNMKEQLS